MGVDIRIAIYDEKREEEIEVLERVLKGYKYAAEEDKNKCPFDIRVYEARLKDLIKARWAAGPLTTKQAKKFNGKRWWNMGIHINDFMKFELPEDRVLLPSQMDYYIAVLKRFVLAVSEEDLGGHVKSVYDLFVEMRNNNLMLYPA